MEREVFLHSFRPVLPHYHRPQDELVEWTLETHQRCAELLGEQRIAIEKLQKYCLSSDYIGERYYECDDVDFNWEKHQIYHLNENEPMGADIFERNQFFASRAKEVF